MNFLTFYVNVYCEIHFTMSGENTEAADRNVEIWKIKKLIKSLEAARG